jgi:peptidoglycan-N-acetylmuramic acid deacetylase
MSDEGHLICNHSYSHGNMANITDLEEFQKELTDLEDYCKQELGITVEKYFRPPQGSYSQSTLEFCKQLEYTPVFWSFAYADWNNKQQLPPEKALEKMKSKIHDGMVVLLHPTSATNGAIIEDFIVSAKEMGYSFGSLHDLKLKINS